MWKKNWIEERDIKAYRACWYIWNLYLKDVASQNTTLTVGLTEDIDSFALEGHQMFQCLWYGHGSIKTLATDVSCLAIITHFSAA